MRRRTRPMPLRAHDHKLGWDDSNTVRDSIRTGARAEGKRARAMWMLEGMVEVETWHRRVEFDMH